MSTNPFLQIDQRFNDLESLVKQTQLMIQNNQQTSQKPMTIDEAAQFLHKSKHTIYGLTSKKRIPHTRRGKKLYFFENELLEWVKTKK